MASLTPRRFSTTSQLHAARRTPVEQLETRQLLAAAITEVVNPWLPRGAFVSQSGGYLTHSNKLSPVDVALTYLQSNSSAMGLTATDIAKPIVTDNYTDADTGLTHLYLRQSFNGLPIINSNLNFNIARNGRILSLGGAFVSLGNDVAISSITRAPAVTASQAISALSGFATNGATFIKPIPVKDKEGHITFIAKQISLDPIAPKLVYIADGKTINLSWEIAIRTPDGAHWFDLNVDASSGKYTSGVDWAERATYNVYPIPTEGPGDTTSGTLPRTTVTDPYDPTVSPYGWHDTNGVAGAEYTDTRGNNVSAQDDTDANNTGGTRPDGGAGLNFDFPLDLTLAPANYLSAATTNLFYWNNLLHDIHARYGFTESAGNFQVTNYSAAGLGADAVQADAQDGSGTNNANFATPPDGTAPRMQMYNFTYTSPGRDGDFDNQIVIHEYGHGVSNRLTGGPANSSALSATQSGGMGEGWSDWWGLMLTMKSTDLKTGKYPVGTYVLGQNRDTGAGIRRYPYAFDMSVDPLTFNHYNTDSSKEVHNTGEIWCTALFDMAWLLIDKYGYSSDVSHGYDAAVAGRNAGNNLALQLVTDALKLQPANPSFTQARDAILQADQVRTGGVNKLQIWTAFARRGLGYSSSTATSSSTTVTIATDLPVDLLKPRVSTISPNVPSLTPISALDLTFSKAMDPASFSIASDVVSFTGPGGTDLLSTISGFTWLNSNTTLRLNFTAVSTNGTYTLTVGPNILAGDDASPMDQNGDGTAGQTPGDRYGAVFSYDALQLAVSSTSPAAESTVSAPFTTIDWTFNEPYNASTLSVSDVTTSQGTVTAVTALDSTHARFTLSGVTTEGTLTLSMPANAVTDASGFGNAAFSENLYVDYATRALPATTKILPNGSLIYSTSFTGTISQATDTDDFTLVLDAGQTLTAWLRPTTSTLRPALTILGPSGTTLGTATAAAANQEAVLQTISAPTAGTYTFRCASGASTTGNYALQVYLNAAVSNEDHSGSSDGTIGSAQNIDSSFLPLAGGSRGAVIGKSEPTYGSLSSEAEPNNTIATANSAAANFVASSGNLYHMGLKVNASVSGEYDYFYIGTLRVGDIITVASGASSSSRGTNTDPHVALTRGTGTTQTAVASDGHSGSGSSDALIYRYTITTTDTYYINVYPYSAGTLDLSVYLEAASTGPTTGGNVTTETEPNDTAATANDVSTSWRKVQHESHTAGTLPTSDLDYLSFTFTAGDLVTFLARGDANTHPRITLLNSAGTTLASEDGTSSASGIGTTSHIFSYIIPATGTYYYQIAAYTGSAAYSADVYVSTTTTLPTPVTSFDYYSFSATAGDHIASVASTLSSGSLAFTLRDASNNVLATSTSGSANVSQAIADFTVPSTGTYYIAVSSGGAATDYSLVVNRNLTFDLKPHNTLATAQDMSGTGKAIGYLTGATTVTFEPDNYAAGTTLNTVVSGITLSIPGTTTNVLSQTSSYISTGTRIFYHGTNGYFTDGSGTSFRATFTVPVNSVSIDLIPDDSDDPGFIRAYNSSGTLIKEVLVAAPVLGSFSKMTVTSTANDIAYIEAGGQSGQTAYLDNMVVNGTGISADYYSVQLTAGQTRFMTTSTPGDGSGEFTNTLNPKIEIYDPSGALIASDDNSAADGRNAILNFTAATTGLYRVCVTSTAGTSGEYVLSTGTPITLTLPAAAQETDGTVNAVVRIPSVLASDLTINLSSSRSGRLTVPSTVIIPAGQTSATFIGQVIDNALLDGQQSITVTAAASGYSSGNSSIVVSDDESAAVLVTLPAAATEGSAPLAGKIVASAAPTENITVLLTSADPTRLTVPASVTLLAGQTTATFSATVVDNAIIDGSKMVFVTATVPNWTSGTSMTTIADNDAAITLTIPTTGWEGQTLSGSVKIGGTLTTALVVNLLSNDTTEATVPATVTIPAGSTIATFNLTLPADALQDGFQTAQISTTATGLSSSTASVVVHDANVNRLAFDTITGPKTAGTAFAVVGRAYNIDSEVIALYSGISTLSASGSTGALTVSPTSATFTSGSWSGSVTLTQADPTVTLKLTTGALSGSSNAFVVQAAALSTFTWGPIAPLQFGHIPFAETITAKDLYGNTITNYSGSPALTGVTGTSTVAPMLGSITYTASSSGTYTLGYIFTPNTNLTVTHVRSLFGTKVSIWNNSGTLLASQAVAGTSGTWAETALTTPITLTAGTSYRIGAYTNGGLYYYRSTAHTSPTFATIGVPYYASGDAYPSVADATTTGYLVDLKVTYGNFTPIAGVTPTNPTFVSGVWTGNVTVPQGASSMRLRIDDGAGHTSDSATFAVIGQDISMILPTDIREDDGVITGQLNITSPSATDLVVQLTSTDPTRLTVPATITIPAGQTSVDLPLTVLDNALLDGGKTITINATAINYTSASGIIKLHDNETATLSVTLPGSAREGDAAVTGTLTASVAPNVNTTITLTSSASSRATVPTTVVLPAGANSVTFPLTVINDTIINGNANVGISATVDNWTDGYRNINIQDNDNTLALTLPTTVVWEGQTLATGGTVRLGGTSTSDILVLLNSSDTTELTVPLYVTVPAGTTSATFALTSLTDGLKDGTINSLVSASASGLIGTSASLAVHDIDLDHLGFDTITGPKSALTPFSVTARMYNASSEQIAIYSGTSTLSATGQAGALTISPTTATFTAGLWTGNVTVSAIDPTVTLSCVSGGVTGLSNAFAVTLATPGIPDLLPASDTGLSNTDNITRLNNATTASALQFVVTNTTPGATVALYSFATQIGSVVATSATTTITTTAGTILTDGINGIMALQRLGGVDTATSTALQVTVDTIAPVAPGAPDLQPSSDTGKYSADNLTKNATPTFDVTSSEAGILHVNVDGVASARTLTMTAGGTYAILPVGGTGGFNSELAVPTITSPYFVTVGDLNNDGRDDLVAGNTTLNTVSVILSKAGGTFQTTATLALSAAANQPIVADFNRDGKADLAIRSTANVIVYPGNGDGTFGTATSYASAAGFYMRTADVNGDGKIDLISTGSSTSGISTLLGNGDGTFQTAITSTIISTPYGLTVGDVDQDGKPDVVLANSVSGIYFCRGNGNGTFSSGTAIYTGGTNLVSVESADLNKDGKLDIAFGDNLGTKSIYVMLGNGNGTFQTATANASLAGTFNVIADFNRDGNLDIAATDNSTSVGILYGNGNGTFQAVTRLTSVASGSFEIASGDINNDLMPDLLVGHTSGASASVYLSKQSLIADGSHTFASWIEDVAGNVSPVSANLPVTIDTVAPTVSASAKSTSDSTPSLAGTVNDNGASVAITINGTNVNAINNGDGTWTLPDNAITTPLAVNSYTYTATATDLAGNSAISAGATLTVIAPPSLASVVINDGSAQRSVIRSITLTFSTPVVLAENAITLNRRTYGREILDVANPSGDQKTFVVTFTDPTIEGGSLWDGIYDLVVHNALVKDLFNTRPIGTDPTQTFHRLFGDSDGDRDVDANDSARFQASLNSVLGDANYRSFFDYDNNGVINMTIEQLEMKKRLRKTFTY